MIIDSHTHLGNFQLFGTSLDLETLVKILDDYNISKAVVSSLPNSLTKEAVNKYPDRFTGLVRINPYGNDISDIISEAVQEWGFHGIKLNPLFNNYVPDDPIISPIMEAAKKYRIPVLIHCGHPPWSLPWSFDRLARRFQDVTIVMAHMGHGHIVYVNGALDVAEDHPNICVDTAGMTLHMKIKEAVERLGEDRVMYGSDLPLGHPAWEIPKVQISGLNEEQLEKVLYKNAETIYQIAYR
jgi:predicted TIM-barrel fold metal-dependent hydrolase